MNKKLALLTLNHIPEGCQGRFNPDRSQLELGVYQLREPSTVPESSTGHTVESRMAMQLDGSQVLASKTFEDDRYIKDVVDELIKKYDGVESHSVGGVEWTAAFRITTTDRIINEYFLGRD